MAVQQWYYRKGTARFGPVSSADIKKMATEGKLEPTDLLRGVGMTEWVAASKIKGLFPIPQAKSVTPQKTEVNDELGLAPLEPIKQDAAPATKSAAKPVSQNPTTKPVSQNPAAKHVSQTPTTKPASQKPVVKSASNTSTTVKPVTQKPVSKPIPTPPNSARKSPLPQVPQPVTPTRPPATPQIPVIPTAPQPFAAANTASNISDPFAQFGFDQPIPNPPFALGTGGFGNLDNLVALEKQGQTIYREPTVSVEPDPFAKKETTQSVTKSDWVADLGPAGVILVFLSPFGVMLILGFLCGAVYALRMYIMGIMAYFMAMAFIFSMTSGVTKMSGFFAGNCLLKLKIKSEIFSLGYGALLGLFSLYVFMAGHIWMTINANPYRGMGFNKNKAEIQEMNDDQNLMLRPDEPAPLDDQDFVPFAAPENAAENVAETEENKEEEEEKNMEENVNDELELFADPEEQKKWEAEQMEMKESAERLMDIADKLENGISIFASFSPFYVFLSFLPFGILLWPVNACILVLGTAHATWTSNLGYDPTKGGM
ncbi:MAG: GYF domain-containing protein [Planctomycetaceae bacterium]|jgi:hypothetical protein|nr:GYF domain-containing protein [Planctomycetaceae bacterium]